MRSTPRRRPVLDQSQAQLRGRTVARLTGEDSRVSDLVRRVNRQGIKMAEYDVELSWPDLPARLVDLHAAPITPGDQGLVLLIQPRAIAETMDKSLSHRNAARSVAGMSAMLAHEVKNPLAGISGAAQLLEMNASEGDRELAALIREEADRIKALMSRVEQFGDIGPARREPVNIHDVLDRAARSAKAGFASQIRFIEDYDPSLPPTPGDADQLMQVMLNLLKNAAEAAPEVGGTITLRTAYRAGMKVATPGGRRESLPLQISVIDNGPGVPEDLQRHIFEPFVSSKADGSGSASRSSPRSSPITAGSSPAIRCPAGPASACRCRSPPRPPSRPRTRHDPGRHGPAGRRRPLDPHGALQALGRIGCRVRATGSASALWRMVEAGEGDVIVTDVHMPDGDALDLLPAIRKRRPELPIIVMSAQNTVLTAIRATEVGAYEYLPKPFDLKELIGSVEKSLEDRNAPRTEAEPGEKQNESAAADRAQPGDAGGLPRHGAADDDRPDRDDLGRERHRQGTRSPARCTISASAPRGRSSRSTWPRSRAS